MDRAITINPTFTDSATMLRRNLQTATRTKRFPTITEPRDVTCDHCGTDHKNTLRTMCRKCGEYIDAR